MESPEFPEFLARPKRFELLTPRFVVKSHPLESKEIFANHVELVAYDDNGLHAVCKLFRLFRHAVLSGIAKSFHGAQSRPVTAQLAAAPYRASGLVLWHET